MARYSNETATASNGPITEDEAEMGLLGTGKGADRPGKASVINKESEELFTPAKIFAIVGSIVSSVCIVMVNKLVLNGGFPFAASLTAVHQAVSFVFSSMLIYFKVIPPIPAPLPEYKYTRLWISGLTATGIVLMNESLNLNSVAFYQVLKMSCIPAIAFLQYILFKKRVGDRVLYTLAIVLLGVGIASLAPSGSSKTSQSKSKVSGDSSIYQTLIAIFVSVGAVFITSLSQLELNQSPDFKRLNSFQSMNIMSFYSFFLCMFAAVMADVKITISDILKVPISLVGLADVTFFEQLGVISDKFGVMYDIIMTKAPLGWILVSSLMAVSVIVFAFSLIKGTSAITFQVVGHLKTVLTLLIGAVLFGSADLMGWKGFGVVIAFVGIILYSKEKM
ncbi:hypothetical protein HDU79_004585 [Rhizoclosmatium sp. JEL0117]|nr:hypothetical protein HDU79_004585 [Rhizoclosmatium sp. JEL0117]